MQKRILALAGALPACGGVDEQTLATFCTVAEAMLRAKLTAGVTAQALGERFLCACALQAAALCVAAAEGGETGMRAGNVSVSRNSGSGKQAAADLRRQALELIADGIVDEGFAFRGVES